MCRQCLFQTDLIASKSQGGQRLFVQSKQTSNSSPKWSLKDATSAQQRPREAQAQVVALRPTYCLSRSKVLRTNAETKRGKHWQKPVLLGETPGTSGKWTFLTYFCHFTLKPEKFTKYCLIQIFASQIVFFFFRSDAFLETRPVTSKNIQRIAENSFRNLLKEENFR